MNELLDLYEELIKGATDDAIRAHLSNFFTDISNLTAAIQAVVAQARQRGEQANRGA